MRVVKLHGTDEEEIEQDIDDIEIELKRLAKKVGDIRKNYNLWFDVTYGDERDK